MPSRQVLPGLLLLASCLPVTGSAVVQAVDAESGWKKARPDLDWSFPEDHWSQREYRNEWWYFTGHLAVVDQPERRFGFQFTIFRVGIVPQVPDLDSAWSASGLLMGHAAVTDLESGRHVFAEVLYRQTPFLARFGLFPVSAIAWSRGPPGTSGDWSLQWNDGGFDLEAPDDVQGFGLHLSTRPVKPLVFQGPNGFSRKAAAQDAASLYYSFTRLATSGQLTVDGASFVVAGESWMDREFSSRHLASGQAGWDWFSLQLDDGRDLMFYILRKPSSEPDFGSATLVDEDGEVTYLEPGSWSILATASWESGATGIRYPAGWHVEVAAFDLILDLVPLVPGQENVSRLAAGLSYWEGAVKVLSVDGSALGRGYVELTGYGDGNRPPL